MRERVAHLALSEEVARVLRERRLRAICARRRRRTEESLLEHARALSAPHPSRIERAALQLLPARGCPEQRRPDRGTPLQHSRKKRRVPLPEGEGGRGAAG